QPTRSCQYTPCGSESDGPNNAVTPWQEFGNNSQLPAIAGNRVFGNKHQIIDLRWTVDLLPLATNIEGDQILFRPPFPQVAHQQLLVPPTSAKMPGPCSAERFSRRGWKRGQFSHNEEVRREREQPVVNASFQLAQGGPEFVETKQASSEHLPQCVLGRPNKSLPLSATPRSSFSGVSPLNAPAGQLVLKLFSRLPTKNDRMNACSECSEVIRLNHFRGASPGHKTAERGEKTWSSCRQRSQCALRELPCR
ncbi:hypothetical protein T12_2050, partial [Trichinella patagoniensis]